MIEQMAATENALALVLPLGQRVEVATNAKARVEATWADRKYFDRLLSGQLAGSAWVELIFC